MRGLLFLFPLLLFSSQSLSKSFQITDDSGQTLTFKKPAERIISLAPHITETLFHIGQGSKVVGIDQSSDFPPQTKKIPKIGNAEQINLEAILELKPDLVIAWYSGNTTKQIARLKEFNIPVYYSEPRLLDDIRKSMLIFGEITGSKSIAKSKAAHFQQKIEQFSTTKGSNQAPVKTFYQVWQQPLMTLNGNHIVSQVISLCGGVNIFSDIPIIAPQVSIESVIQKDPELIIGGTNNKNQFNMWEKWQVINAVRNKQFLTVNSDHLVRAGPRILLGAQSICEKINSLKITN